MIELEIFKKNNLPDLLLWFSNQNNRRFQITKKINLVKAKKLIKTDDRKIVYCIKLNNKAIGYCMLKNLQNQPEIGINIDENYWGKGYGKQVLIILESKVRKLNYRKLSLWVFKDNLRAINLYRNAGYTVMKQKIFKQENTLLYLEKTISLK
jgi:RimJ/RimL family protein N-acetyltransferase